MFVKRFVKPVVVLTGAPCSGKTTAIDTLAADPTVIRVPEAATLYFDSGGRPPLPGARRALLWEAWLVALKISLENAASTQPGRVVVCDRGVADSRAFVDDWTGLLDMLGLTPKAVADRYDAVVHLDVVPPHLYNHDNRARVETFDEAARRGDVARDAWEETMQRPVHLAHAADLDTKVAKVRAVVDAATTTRRQRPVALLPSPDVLIAHAHAVATAPDVETIHTPSLLTLKSLQR